MLSWWYITRPSTTGVKIAIINGSEILLIKNTYNYGFSLPGGGVKKLEKPEDAARREVLEEVGITLENMVHLTTFITHEEYKKDTVHAFCAYVDSKKYILDDFEVESAEWFNLNNLPTIGPVTITVLQACEEKVLHKTS